VLSIYTKRDKRARRDLDRSAIEFFVTQMKLEIERIPGDRKRALVKAQTKCHADEFSDDRLKLFIRCGGMNAKVHLSNGTCFLLSNFQVTDVVCPHEVSSWERSI
jgi:hypothetical protein